ncbi:SCP2 sterol-binding domain-containing protein [Myxococcota bacterium]|jgi:putative sterol carrier protein|nr:SCP2 sterol-binding domain-containing protein [Myxococcota bacterium]
MSDVKATFDHIQSRFNEGMDLGDFSAIYTFELGEEGGSWTIRIEGGKGQVMEGLAEDATCKVQVSAENFVAMTTKKANAQMLFMTGKLKVSGNMGQALKLQKILA